MADIKTEIAPDFTQQVNAGYPAAIDTDQPPSTDPRDPRPFHIELSSVEIADRLFALQTLSESLRTSPLPEHGEQRATIRWVSGLLCEELASRGDELLIERLPQQKRSFRSWFHLARGSQSLAG